MSLEDKNKVKSSRYKKKSDGNMILDIDGKKIDIEIFLADDLTALRYELTSKSPIDHGETAFCLFVLVKAICEQAGISVDSLVNHKAMKHNIDTNLH